jgi:hypothetical protein
MKKQIKFNIENNTGWNIYTCAISKDNSIAAFGVNGYIHIGK